MPLAGLPLVAAIALMWFWQRHRRQHRAALDRFSDAKLMLARVVLELDALEVRYLSAHQVLTAAEGVSKKAGDSLTKDWESVHQGSLEMARLEQEIEKFFAGTRSAHTVENRLLEIAPEAAKPRDFEADKPIEVPFRYFESQTVLLKERADALAAASELQAGHAGSQSVLDRLALPLIQAIDDLMRRDRQRPGTADLVRGHRETLLALSLEAEAASTLDTSDHDDEAAAQQLVTEQAQLLRRWNDAEQAMMADLESWRSKLPTDLFYYREGDPAQRVEERVRARIRSLTGGKQESFNALRATLGLGHGQDHGPLYSVEHCLELLDSSRKPMLAAASEPEEENWWLQGSTLVVVIPIALSLLAGVIGASDVQSNTRYGKVLTGDQELAGLQVAGDVSLLEEPAELSSLNEGMTQQDSLDVDFIREDMARSAERSPDRALLPDRVELTVMVLPVDDYIPYELVHEFSRPHIEFNYFDLLQAYHQIKADAAVSNPELLNDQTDEIAAGQALLPIWVMEDGRYGLGATLTGDISSGIDSRLGSYAFRYTEVTLTDPEEESRLVGEQLAYDLTELGRVMEYNHQETQQVSGTQIFWLSAVTAWGAIQMLMIIGAAVMEQVGKRFGSFGAQRQLRNLRQQLNALSLGLDLSRLDMVAVLGGDSATGGRAEQSDQRLYEAGLVTALREVQALERLPRKQKRGEAWVRRVEDAQRIIDSLSAREKQTSEQAEALLRSQR